MVAVVLIVAWIEVALPALFRMRIEVGEWVGVVLLSTRVALKGSCLPALFRHAPSSRRVGST